MRLLDNQAAIGTAILLLSTAAQAKHSHLEALERRHSHHHLHKKANLPRSVQCPFPTNAGLVAVTPGEQNAGWAMSPDQPCLPGHYCPYACPPGQLMAQWDPSATAYVYPKSMNGGLYCNADGTIEKPFPNKGYCYAGTGSIGAKNECGKQVSFCQTVLPGNEAMLIPTLVMSSADLAVPGTNYWASTAAHYYVNPPGVGTDEGCVWGDGSKPIGNWSPYVAGANSDASGNTFVKLAWNPIYTGESSFANTLPSWGLKIECDGGGCNGLPCSIDPSVNAVNGVTSADQATGAGGGNFCVVTVPSGSKANIVVFEADGSGSSGDSSSSSTVSSTSTSSSASSTSTSTSSTSSTSTSSSTSSTSTSTSISTSSSSWAHRPVSKTTTKTHPSYTNAPHILFENSTSSATASYASGTISSSPSASFNSSGSATPTTSGPVATISKGAASGTFATGTVAVGALIAAAFSFIL